MNSWFEENVNFKDLVADTVKRYRLITLWVPCRFHQLKNHNYKCSSPDCGNFNQCTQKDRKLCIQKFKAVPALIISSENMKSAKVFKGSR